MRNFLTFLVLFLFGATLVNIYLPVSSAAEKEQPLTDDAIICKDSLLYFIGGDTEIVGYCKDLMERGL